MSFIKSLFAKSPTIETDRLIIRHMRVSDAKAMFEYAQDCDVTKYLLWSPHENIEYTRWYLKTIEKEYSKGEYYDFAIELKEEGKFIGTCGFANIDEQNRKGEVGYVLNPRYHGKGYATEAVGAILALGFEKLKLNRIEARYMVGNTASRRVMEKCHMTFEGVGRQSMYVKEEFRDIGTCAILKNEFDIINTKVQKFTNI